MHLLPVGSCDHGHREHPDARAAGDLRPWLFAGSVTRVDGKTPTTTRLVLHEVGAGCDDGGGVGLYELAGAVDGAWDGPGAALVDRSRR
jgi:hypothetical protein